MRSRQPERIERLGERPDLIELDQHGVAGMTVDPLLQASHLRGEQVVADQLDRRTESRLSMQAHPAQSSSASPSSIEMIG